MAWGLTRFTLFPNQAAAEAAIASFDGRKAIADEIADEARANSPIVTGEFRDGIGVQVDGTNVAVVDTDPEAVWKEFGTSNMAGIAVLTDAVRSRGKYRGWKPNK